MDIRGFTPFCQREDSADVATYIKKIYINIIETYFMDANFIKPTGDGLLIIKNYNEEDIREISNDVIEKCMEIVEIFPTLLNDDPMINFETPKNIGLGIARGSACCLKNDDKIIDYSGRILNLASRLMDIARPLLLAGVYT